MSDELNFDKCRKILGKLVMAFGNLEYEMLRGYKAWLPERNFFEDDYLGCFDKLIGAAKRNLENSENIQNLLIALKKLAPARHLVAHNPIFTDIYVDDSNGDSFVELCIYDNRGKDRMSFNELESIADKAFDLYVELGSQLRIKVPQI